MLEIRLQMVLQMMGIASNCCLEAIMLVYEEKFFIGYQSCSLEVACDSVVEKS